MHKLIETFGNQAKFFTIPSENFLFVEVNIINVDGSPAP